MMPSVYRIASDSLIVVVHLDILCISLVQACSSRSMCYLRVANSYIVQIVPSCNMIFNRFQMVYDKLILAFFVSVKLLHCLESFMKCVHALQGTVMSD